MSVSVTSQDGKVWVRSNSTESNSSFNKKSNLLQIAGDIAKQLTQCGKIRILLSLEKYFVKSSFHCLNMTYMPSQGFDFCKKSWE